MLILIWIICIEVWCFIFRFNIKTGIRKVFSFSFPTIYNHSEVVVFFIALLKFKLQIVYCKLLFNVDIILSPVKFVFKNSVPTLDGQFDISQSHYNIKSTPLCIPYWFINPCKIIRNSDRISPKIKGRTKLSLGNDWTLVVITLL